MGKKHKLLFWVAIAMAALCAAVVIAAIAIPRLIDTEAVRSKITTMVSRQVGGTVDYGRLELDIWPLPCVRLHSVEVAIPETGRLSVAEMGVYPRIFALLSGNLHLVRLNLDSPVIEIEKPGGAKADPDGNEPAEAGDWREKASAFLSELGVNAPDMTVVVQNGRLRLLENHTPLLQVEDINARMVSPPKDLAIDIACRSDAWELVAVKVNLNAKTLAGNGQITLQNVNFKKLLPLLFPGATTPITASIGNLDATLKSNESGQISARWTASLPVLTIQLKNETVELPVDRLDGKLQLTADDLRVDLSGIQIAKPALSLSGNLLMANASPRITIEAKIPQNDLKPVREMTLKLAGDIPAVRKITDVVRAGTAIDTLVRLQGDSWTELGSMNSFYLKGGMTDGNIFVPDLELDLKNVSGEVTIADSVLACKNVAGTLGKSVLSGGILTLPLAAGVVPFHLEADIAADLKELPRVLEKTITDKAVLEQIRAISQIDGQAQGKLTLDESNRQIDVTVQVNSVQATLKHPQIPYPVQLTRGRFSFKKNRVETSDLFGTVGQSAFEKLSGQLTLAAPFAVTMTAARLQFDLEENLKWINRVEALRDSFRDLRSLRGVADLANISLKGPLAAPLEWVARATGKMADGYIDNKSLPHPLTIRRANFEVSTKNGHFTLTHSDTDVILLDAALNISGSLERAQEGITHTEVNFRGDMQSESVKYLSQLLRRPKISQIRSPIKVSEGHLVWEKDKQDITVSAALQIADAPTVTLDLHQVPQEVKFGLRLSRREEKMAEFSLALSGNTAELAFKGEVDGTTIAKLVTTIGYQPEKLRGDFKARILLDQPRRSTATGRLEIKEVVFPWEMPFPIRIQEAVLTGKGNQLAIENAEVIFQELQVALDGEIDFSDKGIELRMNLTGDRFDLTPVVKSLAGKPGGEQTPAKTEVAGKPRKSDKKAVDGEPLPLYGTIRVDVGQLTYDQMVWKPFRADVALTPGRVDVTVTEAALCGLAMPGKLAFTPRDVAVDIALSAKKQNLAPTLNCLLGPDINASGTFDLEGVFKGRSEIGGLARSIEGQVKFVSRKGRIYRDFLLKNILAFVSITEVFVGRLPDFGKEGFAYYSIESDVEIKNGKAMIIRSVMDGSSVDVAMAGEMDYLNRTIDVKGLAAPLKTVRRVIDLVPFVGTLLADTFTTIPFQANGKWEDPRVKTTFMSSIAPGLAGLLQNLGQETPYTTDPTAGERD